MKPGETIKGTGYTYVIESPLGEGKTVKVYLATDNFDRKKVALKVLHSDASPEIIKSFFLEAEILNEFKKAEEELDDKRAILYLYKIERNKAPKFLAQELVSGISLKALLDAPPYCIKEPDALDITSQVARVLHLLHTKLERSYTDFQFQNIYWEKSSKRVQVLDWNHVSDRFKNRTPEDEEEANRLKQADLSLLGVYLYMMLTGKATDPQGEKEKLLAARAGKDCWDAISEGTRRLMLRMLHPNPERRFASAATLREEVDWLAEQSGRKGEDLVKDIFRFCSLNLDSLSWSALEPLGAWVPEIKSASDTTQLNLTEDEVVFGFAEHAVERARMMLSFARLSKSEVEDKTLDSLKLKVEEQSKAIRTKLKGNSNDPFGAGRTYYDSDNYGRAYELWVIAAEETGLLDHWRWVQVALVGKSNSKVLALPGIKEDIAKALEAMKEGLYEQAKETLLKIQAQQVLLDTLLAELEAHELINEARRVEKTAASPNEYEKAADLYDKAEEILQRRIP